MINYPDYLVIIMTITALLSGIVACTMFGWFAWQVLG